MLNKLKNIILVKFSQITMFKELENTLHYFTYYMWHLINNDISCRLFSSAHDHRTFRSFSENTEHQQNLKETLFLQEDQIDK